MAVAYRASGQSANASSSTIPFIAPSTVSANDVWICVATFRGGTAALITGVPASFTQITRVNAGALNTSDILVAYWYVATGTETPSAQFATITSSTSSKSVTQVDAFSGVNTSAPVTGSAVSGTGTTSATSTALGAVPTGDFAYAAFGDQGTSTAPGGISGSSSGALTATVAATSTTGGSSATNVGLVTGYRTGSVVSQTYTDTISGASSASILAFDLASSSVTVVTNSDSGTGSELTQVGTADTGGGAGSDAPTLVVTVDSEAGTGTSTNALINTVTSADSGTGSSTTTIGYKIFDNEYGGASFGAGTFGASTFGSTESQQLAQGYSGTDAGIGSEPPSTTGVSDSDAGSGSSTQALTFGYINADAGTGNDVPTLINVRASDQGTGSSNQIQPSTHANFYPDAIISDTNFTGTVAAVQDDPDNPAGTWLVAANCSLQDVAYFSFPSPNGTLTVGANVQEFRILLKQC